MVSTSRWRMTNSTLRQTSPAGYPRIAESSTSSRTSPPRRKGKPSSATLSSARTPSSRARRTVWVTLYGSICTLTVVSVFNPQPRPHRTSSISTSTSTFILSFDIAFDHKSSHHHRPGRQVAVVRHPVSPILGSLTPSFCHLPAAFDGDDNLKCQGCRWALCGSVHDDAAEGAAPWDLIVERESKHFLVDNDFPMKLQYASLHHLSGNDYFFGYVPRGDVSPAKKNAKRGRLPRIPSVVHTVVTDTGVRDERSALGRRGTVLHHGGSLTGLSN